MVGSVHDLRTTVTIVYSSDVRCTHCGRLLFKWQPKGISNISVKCPRCGKLDAVHLSTG